MLVFNDDFNQAAGYPASTSIWGPMNGTDPNNGGVHYVNTTQTLQVVNDPGALDGKALAMTLEPPRRWRDELFGDQNSGKCPFGQLGLRPCRSPDQDMRRAWVRRRWPAFWMMGTNRRLALQWRN